MMRRILKQNWVTVVVLLTAVALVALGISTEEPFDVLQKAIHICLECIGVG